MFPLIIVRCWTLWPVEDVSSQGLGFALQLFKENKKKKLISNEHELGVSCVCMPDEFGQRQYANNAMM